MTAPVFLTDSLDSVVAGTVVSLEGDEARHATRVRRIKPGERIDIVDGAGRRAMTIVKTVSSTRVECEALDIVYERPPTRRIIVLQALAKGDRGERAVETLTEVGVDVIVPWAAQRSVTVWAPDRVERGVQRWQATAREATKQSRRAWQPEVTDPVDLLGACRWVAQSAHAFILDAQGEPLPRLLGRDRGEGDWVIVVGPEGGITEAETQALLDAGGHLTGLGRTIMRTSTAGTVAAAVIAAHDRWSSSPVHGGTSVTGSSS